MLVGARATLAIESLNAEGLGQARRDGLALLVPGAAPEDVVEVRVVARSRHHAVAWCEIERVRERGPSYRDPSCPHAGPTRGRCGGCPVAHVTPAAAQAMKTTHVVTALQQHGLDLPVVWTPADSEVGYRNRAHFAAGRDVTGRILLGSFAPRSRDISPMGGCEVLRPPLAERAASLQRALAALQVPVYPEPDGLRYASLRANPNGDTLLDLIIAGQTRRWIAEYTPQLAACAEWHGISYSVNLSEGNAMRVSASTLAYGEQEIVEPIGPIRLRLTASAFSQLNTSVCTRMYGLGADVVRPPRTIWDWYCGAGGLGLTVASRFARPDLQLFGADSVHESIALARRNAQEAMVPAEFRVVNLGEELPRNWPAPDLVLVNPPRRGLDAPVLSNLVSLSGAELVYMSCNPTAFARDAALLTRHGWRFSPVHAFDMLPRTTHVELIARAQRG